MHEPPRQCGPVRLRGLTFEAWLRSHGSKDRSERWLRELYPWPVFAEVEYGRDVKGLTQNVSHQDVEYKVVVRDVTWQEEHGTFKYRVHVGCAGLGWLARSYDDEFDICARGDGTFVTLFHAAKKEPLERIAKAFLARRWDAIDREQLATLAVSRFLAATLVGKIAEEAFVEEALQHVPSTRLIKGVDPLFTSAAGGLVVGYRFFAENAYEWARMSRGAKRVVGLYCADTKYQFRTDLPPRASVQSVAELDDKRLSGKYADLIRVILRGNEMPGDTATLDELSAIVSGRKKVAAVMVTERDVHEALAAMKLVCRSKADLRYQLAAAVTLNAWIESELRLGFVQRKKFFAFKKQVAELVSWAAQSHEPGVDVWVEPGTAEASAFVFVRIDDVDFSFQAVPLPRTGAWTGVQREWSGVRLKPIAPLVLGWARQVRDATTG